MTIKKIFLNFALLSLAIFGSACNKQEITQNLQAGTVVQVFPEFTVTTRQKIGLSQYGGKNPNTFDGSPVSITFQIVKTANPTEVVFQKILDGVMSYQGDDDIFSFLVTDQTVELLDQSLKDSVDYSFRLFLRNPTANSPVIEGKMDNPPTYGNAGYGGKIYKSMNFYKVIF